MSDVEEIQARVWVYDVVESRLWDKTFSDMDSAVEYFQGVSQERGFDMTEHYYLLKVVGEVR